MQDMNNLQKYFLKDIERQSDLEIERLQVEHETARTQAIKEIQLELKKEAELLLDQELKEMASEYTVKNSKLNEEKNRKLMKKREEMTAIIFDEIAKKLKEYVKSSAYVELLQQQIKDLKMQNERVVFYIGEHDVAKLKVIFVKMADVQINVDPNIHIGGFRMENEQAGIVVDNTLDTRLDDEKAWFYANSSLAIR